MLAGGALLSAVDHAGSLAAWMTNTLGDRTLFGSTINTKLQTFAPVVNRDVIVKARAVGGDRTLVNAVVDIVTEQGEYIASGSTVYRIVKRNPEG
jgi:acyl-coenzyme A thioesterase PaaI-like protein